MPELIAKDILVPSSGLDAQPALRVRLPTAAHYGLALLFVALATGVGFAADAFISAPSLTLIYVLPVVAAATIFGWGPSLLAVVAGVLAFDFFFTVPYYSFTMTDPAEIWAAALLFVIAAIVASVAATSRRRALDAQEAAERADALQELAHVAIGSPGQDQLLQAAAATLHRIFRGPAIVFLARDGDLGASATAGGARIRDVDMAAARGALSTQVNTRGETYPHVQTYFDFWPVSTGAGLSCVLGVDLKHATRDRPTASEKLVESVAAYVAGARVRDEAATVIDLKR